MGNDRGMVEQHAGNTRLVLFETVTTGHQYWNITNVRISTVCEDLG